MVNLGKGLVDRMVHGAFFGKRQVGRPIKYNIRPRGKSGFIELIFNPRSPIEKIASSFIRFAHPYLAFITYRFHVEKCRDAGIRVEDMYMHKFHKEPYFHHHIYAQHFHPATMQEKVRDIKFFRNPRTLYKGFTVPDWATADQCYGWDIDMYSRLAWDQAHADFMSEATPMAYWGEQRLEPNPLQWLRLEQFGKGASSRLFYNEVPKPMWWRHGGHLHEDTKQELLYSFTHADQESRLVFGMDTSTEEGRVAFKKEWDAISELTPEIIKKDQIRYPHEIAKPVSNEAHFQRIWGYYRDHTFRNAISNSVSKGEITQAEADSAVKFLGGRHTLSVFNYCLAKQGSFQDLVGTEGFEATDKVMKALGMVNFDTLTSEPYTEQFWGNFDAKFELTEIQMREDLPLFISDPSGRAQVEALMEETTKALPI